MGVGLTVACPCFGQFTMQVGRGMAGPRPCLFPFLCTACEKVSEMDVYANPLTCRHCGGSAVVPYGRPPALGEPGAAVVFACPPHDAFSAADLTLTDGTYWCPTCRQYTARFSDSGMLWD